MNGTHSIILVNSEIVKSSENYNPNMAKPSSSNLKLYYQILAFVSKLIYPSFPCYFFPSFLLIQVYNELVKLKKNPKFRVIPLPNEFYNKIVSSQPFLGDHFGFVSDEIFDKYELDSKQNWLNVVFGNGNGSCSQNSKQSPDIVQTILSKPNSSVVVPIIAVAKCQKNWFFVSENCYQNWCIKNKIRDTQPLLINLQKKSLKQILPKLATRATVFLIKNPYDLNLEVTDEIITNYFSTPRVLYRNHTYAILLNEDQVGPTLYSQNFHTFLHLKKIYFRCVHLESSDNQFENFAIVAKGATTLHQSTSINYPIPRQFLDDFSFISACPWGLMRHFKYIKSCILPFVGNNFYSTSTSGSPSSSSSTATAAMPLFISNHIFPTFLVQGDRGCGKKRLVHIIARSMGFQQFCADCGEITSNAIPAQVETKLKLAMAKASTCDPIVFILNNFELFGVDNEGREDLRILTLFQTEVHNLFTKERSYPVILIAVANGKVLPPIQSQFLETITIDTPDKNERFNHLQWLWHKEVIIQEIFNGCHNDYSDIPLWNGRSMQASINK